MVKRGVSRPWWRCVLTGVTSFHLLGVAWQMLNYRHTSSVMVCFWKFELSGSLWKWKHAFWSFFVLGAALRGSVPMSVHWPGGGRRAEGQGRRGSQLAPILHSDSFRKFELAPQRGYFWLLQLVFEVYFYLLLISVKLKARLVSS